MHLCASSPPWVLGIFEAEDGYLHWVECPKAILVGDSKGTSIDPNLTLYASAYDIGANNNDVMWMTKSRACSWCTAESCAFSIESMEQLVSRNVLNKRITLNINDSFYFVVDQAACDRSAYFISTELSYPGDIDQKNQQRWISCFQHLQPRIPRCLTTTLSTQSTTASFSCMASNSPRPHT